MAKGKCPKTEGAPGLAAEREVRDLLATLVKDGCLVMNDVPFPYGNLDHVVVRLRQGYAGQDAGQVRPDRTVFLIETKSQHGRVTWNGKHLLINGRPFARNPICQMNRGIRWMQLCPGKQLFGLPVRGRLTASALAQAGTQTGTNPWIVAVLVFPNAVVHVRRPVQRINVMSARDLPAFIRSYPGKT
jgi:hypothetical protein